MSTLIRMGLVSTETQTVVNGFVFDGSPNRVECKDGTVVDRVVFVANAPHICQPYGGTK